MTASTLRAFVGLPLEPKVRAELGKVSNWLREQCAREHVRARFSLEANLHLTLQFLGDVDADRVPAIAAALSPIERTPPFELGLGGLGAFHSENRASVVWVGVVIAEQVVKRLAEQVNRCLSSLAFPVETRPYHPHVTLARIKSTPTSLVSVLRAVSPPGVGTSRVQEVVLYRSEPGPEGSKYSPLATIALGGQAKEEG